MADVSVTPKSIWNIDDERLKQLNYYLTLSEECFVDWDLEGIYTYLLASKRVSSPKLQKSPNGWTNIKKKQSELEHIRREMTTSKNAEHFSRKRIEYYNKAQEFYEELSKQLQEHGIFFREGLDPSQAAMRR